MIKFVALAIAAVAVLGGCGEDDRRSEGAGRAIPAAPTTSTDACTDLIVFLDPETTDDELDAFAERLRADERMEVVDVLDHQEAFAEFRSLFEENQPELVASITPGVLPPNVKVDLKEGSTDELVRELKRQRGVLDVVAMPSADPAKGSKAPRAPFGRFHC